MEVELELMDSSPFFIRPFVLKETLKPIQMEIDKLETLGILKKDYLVTLVLL